MSFNDGPGGKLLLSRVSGVLFNIFAKNEAINMNSVIYKLKKRGHTNRRGGSAAKKKYKNCNHNHVVLQRKIKVLSQ